jgi:hypothetical protein
MTKVKKGKPGDSQLPLKINKYAVHTRKKAFVLHDSTIVYSFI